MDQADGLGRQSGVKRVEEFLQLHRFQLPQSDVAPAGQKVRSEQEFVLCLCRILQVLPNQPLARFVEN